MIATISTIIGLVSGVLPGVIKYFENKEDKKYKIELQRLKNELATRPPADIQAAREIEELKAMVENLKSARALDDMGPIDVSFMGQLRASVRPVITYTFFGMFVLTKIGLGFLMITNGIDPRIILNTLLDETTMSMFGAVMAFWFGTRPLEKYYERKSKDGK